MERTHTPGLSGENALVTGGGSGLGFSIARAFIEAGARVCISGRRESVLDEAVKRLGENSTYVVGDVTKAGDRTRMVDAVTSKWGVLSILVNNAGQSLKKPALEVTDDEFDQLMDTHVKSAFSLTREVGRLMIEAGHGNILFIASMASYMGVPQIVGYTAAKTAVIGLTRALAAEWSESGVRVNAIAPGWISTPMTDWAFAGDPARKEKVLSRTPMKRMGEPSDIGMTAAFLCSDAAKFITGQCIPVDGGASIGF
ncbi:MAG: SDR family oxidoreductase [Opitutaceae bacterium]